MMGAMKKVASQLGVVKGSEEDEAAKGRCVRRARSRRRRASDEPAAFPRAANVNPRSLA